jgi:predicted glycosyltransferase involved in capsule biosynthesis
MKEDYVRAGGMDESFVGYGFADNDMTYNVMKMGVRATWMDDKEVHLCHAKETMENRLIVGFEKYRHTSQRNLNRFIRKWGLRQYSEHYRHMIL